MHGLSGPPHLGGNVVSTELHYFAVVPSLGANNLRYMRIALKFINAYVPNSGIDITLT